MNRDDARAMLSGPIASVRLPFTRDGEVDHAGLREFIERCIANGTLAIVLTAGDSHYACLSDAEIGDVTRTTISQVGGRAMVVAADRYHSTTRSTAFARFARDEGADIVMCLPPDWGRGCTPESLAEHYAEVSRVLPVMIVTNLFRAWDHEPALRAVEFAIESSDRVVAVKEDVCGEFARDLCKRIGSICPVFAGGFKSNHLNLIDLDTPGYLTTFLSFAPEITRRYWDATQTGDLDTARQIAEQWEVPFYELGNSMPGRWNAAYHATLELFGICGRWRRKPYATLDDEHVEKLREFFVDRGMQIEGLAL